MCMVVCVAGGAFDRELGKKHANTGLPPAVNSLLDVVPYTRRDRHLDEERVRVSRLVCLHDIYMKAKARRGCRVTEKGDTFPCTHTCFTYSLILKSTTAWDWNLFALYRVV